MAFVRAPISKRRFYIPARRRPTATGSIPAAIMSLGFSQFALITISGSANLSASMDMGFAMGTTVSVFDISRINPDGGYRISPDGTRRVVAGAP